MSNAETTMTTSPRIWLWAAVVMSVLVLVLLAVGLIGTWVGRSTVIRTVDSVLVSVDQLAGTGREGIQRANSHLSNIREVTTQVETAVSSASQNVAERGVIMSLLPQEQQQIVEQNVQLVGETVESIRSVVNAASELMNAIDNLPFISAPRPAPEKVSALQDNVETIQSNIDQITSSVQQAREGAAARIDTVAQAAGEVNMRLAAGEQTLTELDNELEALQDRTVALKQQIRVWTAIFAVVVTIVDLWIAYALIMLVRRHWHQLQSS